MPQEVVSFRAAKSSGLFLPVFMIVHALSLTGMLFAGLIGLNGASTHKAMAMAAMIAVGAAALITVLVHIMLRQRFSGKKDPDTLRLTPDGLSGQPFLQKGIALMPWDYFEKTSVDGKALVLHFAPLNADSDKPADRITRIRIPSAENATAEQLKEAIDTYPRP